MAKQAATTGGLQYSTAVQRRPRSREKAARGATTDQKKKNREIRPNQWSAAGVGVDDCVEASKSKNGRCCGTASTGDGL